MNATTSTDREVLARLMPTAGDRPLWQEIRDAGPCESQQAWNRCLALACAARHGRRVGGSLAAALQELAYRQQEAPPT